MPKIMHLAEVLRFILNHPLNREHKLRALGRFLHWQVGGRMAPGPVIIPFVNDTRLVARPGLMGATGIYYTGLYEFEEMAFVLHALRPGDLFIDIGAHIGAFSVLAAGAVGADCLAIEPVPASFAYLQENINLNGLNGKIRALNVGIASQAGRLRFTTGKGAANGVVPPNSGVTPSGASPSGATHFESALHLASTIEVDVLPLDALAPDAKLSAITDFSPMMLKIDVEGYEHEVIAGAGKTLADDRLAAILIELRGHGARYGFDEEAIHRRLLEAGFLPYSYVPESFAASTGRAHDKGKGIGDRGEPPPTLKASRQAPALSAALSAAPADRRLTPLPGINRRAGTTLYLRNLDLIQQRLANPPIFTVLGQEL